MNNSFKETVRIISTEFLFKERHPPFTTLPFKPLTDHRGQRTQCV